MRPNPIRFMMLVIMLIGAFIYRFPVDIERIYFEVKDVIRDKIEAMMPQKKDGIEEAPLETKDRTALAVVSLKNGGKIKGFIENEDKKGIELDVGHGTALISWKDIDRVDSPDAEEEKELYRRLTESPKTVESVNSTEIKYSESNRIRVDAQINGELELVLILDTGAPYIVITPRVAKGMFDHGMVISKSVNMEWADGRVIKGRLVLLRSVRVGDVEVKNIKAVICDIPIMDPGMDGLLGMSFLKKFDVKINATERKVVLTKK